MKPTKNAALCTCEHRYKDHVSGICFWSSATAKGLYQCDCIKFVDKEFAEKKKRIKELHKDD